ncbi:MULTISPECIES: hypothetical protein [Kocuria]|uniref:hypothetical protein n=1 Tax=Kocuria TaxID=57493 RepID=UPI000738D859|nr:hypothetical protein [Kocuria palustris]KUG54794.1 hypothetical protein AVL60_00015 [Kocuria palustris]
MTIISPCRYNSAGQLLVPRRADIDAAADRALDEAIFEDTSHATFDRGFYHRFVIDVIDASPDAARDRLDAKLERFIDMGSSKGRYRAIRRTPSTGTVGRDRRIKMSYTLIYAIE